MRIKALFLSEFKGKTVIIFPNRKQFMIENIQPEGAALGSIYTCDLLGVRYCVDFSIHAIAKKWIHNPFYYYRPQTKLRQGLYTCLSVILFTGRGKGVSV